LQQWSLHAAVKQNCAQFVTNVVYHFVCFISAIVRLIIIFCAHVSLRFRKVTNEEILQTHKEVITYCTKQQAKQLEATTLAG